MIKKILCGLAIATSLVACNSTDDYTDWADPQSNAQPETVKFGDGSVTTVGVIDFASLEGDSVQVCSVTAPSVSTTGYTPIYKLTLTKDNKDVTVLPLSVSGKIAADDLKNYIELNYGKAPEVREIPSYVTMWTTNGVQTVKQCVSSIFNINAKLVAPEIYEHLYLIGAPSQWDPTCTELPFAHSDKSVFDDPVFTITFKVAAGDTWFALADDKTVSTADWNNVFGCREGNGKNLVGETGNFTRRTELSDDGSFMVHADAETTFKMTVNVLDGTYYLEALQYAEYIYFIGATDGWTDSKQRLAHVGEGVYTGLCYVADPNGWGLAFKFQREAGSWDNEINAGVLANHEGVHGDNNFEVDAAGVYYMEADLVNGGLKCTLVKTMGLIGGFNEWATDDVMTWDADNLCYVKEGATVSNAGWKFRINADWGINLGGSLGNLILNGDNLADVGTTIKLYPCRTNSNNIYCTVEK